MPNNDDRRKLANYILNQAEEVSETPEAATEYLASMGVHPSDVWYRYCEMKFQNALMWWRQEGSLKDFALALKLLELLRGHQSEVIAALQKLFDEVDNKKDPFDEAEAKGAEVTGNETFTQLRAEAREKGVTMGEVLANRFKSSEDTE